MLDNQRFNWAQFMPSSHAVSLSIWVVSLLCIVLTTMLANGIYNYLVKKADRQNWVRAASKFIRQVINKPLIFLLCSYLMYAGLVIAHLYIPSLDLSESLSLEYAFNIVEFAAFFWLLFNVLVVGKARLVTWAINTHHRTLSILLPAIANSLQAATFLLMLNLLIPLVNLNGLPGLYLNKFAKVFFIATLGWVFVQVVNVLERFIVSQYIETDPTNLAARRINTQVLVLKRVVISIGIVVTLAAILMVFDSVKSLGTGLLTTAGIVSAVGAFASQQSLGRIFAGLQIAFTQPIRIGDTVIVDKEFGQVEEITLSYIVVKLWDLRRLILPTDYFTSKGLQNLTRDTTQLLGTIFIYTDYTLPIDEVRAKFQEMLAASPLWDRKVSSFQVTDIKENTMEIRALMSAENSSTLWNLRCEIREQLIKFIVQHYPECLSKSRSLTTNLIPATQLSK